MTNKHRGWELILKLFFRRKKNSELKSSNKNILKINFEEKKI